ncbi:hypothetical protein [Streptomyces albidocamelliae]|uniref:Protein kilB n=1 Tax=Streptomyces albidocamelliae TaxID=2981135 RepID=A0ABY6F1M0_9ACTN|nr:hypothetical protein [Streptomyces sp. HUAS 14-6]UXY40478.1 hypothetical protein N8I86_38595 [Streptomyces sp. HUAS 14-6]
MTITPVALALISTGAGLLGSVIGTVGALVSSSLSQRATRDREADFKVWERRADAIEEAHRKMLALGNARELAWARRELPSGLSPADLDPGHQDEQFRLVVTKLTLYTTPELVRAYRNSNEAFLKSLLGIQRVQLALAQPGGESDRPRRQRNINAAVAVATRAIEESKAADEQLEAALRTAAALTASRRRR